MRNIAIFFVILLYGCKTYPQNDVAINCKEEIKEGFIIPTSGKDPAKSRIQDTLFPELNIVLESGFKDSLRIYINDSLIEYKKFETDFSTGYTGKSIHYNYASIKNSQIELRIQEKNNKYCMQTNIRKGYRILAISRFDNKWWLNYSNYKLSYE